MDVTPSWKPEMISKSLCVNCKLSQVPKPGEQITFTINHVGNSVDFIDIMPIV